MARNLSDILNEAEGIIEKRASAAAKPVAPVASDDEVIKLANFLNDEAQVKASPTPASTEEFTLAEKVAHALAIVDTLTFIEEHEKIAQFEALCREKGYDETQIAEFIEKKAFNSASKYVLPAALAGVGGLAYGHSKGKKKGYNQALDDISAMMSGSPSQES